MTTRTWTKMLSLAALALATAACSNDLIGGVLPWQSVSGASDGVTSPNSVSESPCLPEFAPLGAWRSADGGRAVVLPNGTAVHLFGDTVLAEDGTRPPAMVGNSIGVAACDGPDFVIDYHWQDDGETRRAFFDMGDPAFRMWPADGFFDEGRLHVVLSKIVEVDYGWGFDYGDGAVLATVDNPLEHPSSWSVEYRTLSQGRGLWPNKGVTVDGAHAYIYTELHAGPDAYPSPTGLARLALDAVGDPEASLEYLSTDRTWEPATAFTYDDAFVVAADASMNMYVHHNAALDQWLTVQASVRDFSSAVVRTADALEGPWTRGELAFRFPEVLTDPAHVLCYAVTEQPQHQLDGGRTLVVTYACNTPGELAPMGDLELYLPKTVLVDVGPGPAS